MAIGLPEHKGTSSGRTFYLKTSRVHVLMALCIGCKISLFRIMMPTAQMCMSDVYKQGTSMVENTVHSISADALRGSM